MEITFLRKFPEGQKKICKRKNVFIFLSPIKVVNLLSHLISAASLGDLKPFGLLFEPFGDQYFDLAIFKFANFLGYY